MKPIIKIIDENGAIQRLEMDAQKEDLKVDINLLYNSIKGNFHTPLTPSVFGTQTEIVE